MRQALRLRSDARRPFLQQEVSGIAVGRTDIGRPAVGIAIVEGLDEQRSLPRTARRPVAGDAIEIGGLQRQLVLAELERGLGALPLATTSPSSSGQTSS